MDAFEILRARIVTSISWHIMPFRMVHRYQSFGTACCLHHQNSTIFFQHNLLFLDIPENGGRKFLRILALIRMRCHILRDTDFFVSLGGHTCVAITIHAFMNWIKSSLACSPVGWRSFNWFSHGGVSIHKPYRCYNHFTSSNGILWKRE